MLLTVIVLITINTIIILFAGRFITPSNLKFLTIIHFSAAILALHTPCFKAIEYPATITICAWIKIHNSLFNFGLIYDTLSITISFIVLGVSGIVHLYSFIYISGDAHLPRFIGTLSLFTFFMLILVTAHNLLQTFIGWEGVGFCSFLLISFWFTRIQAGKAALKAILINKVGDMSFFLGFCLCLFLFKTTDFHTIFAISSYGHTTIVTLIILCFVIAALSKSAQIGFHIWLTDAIEGPTPVSALLHAATIVTAGVYLLIRLNPIITLPTSIAINTNLFFIACLTLIFSGVIAVNDFDIKKIIALSTCNHLALIFIFLSLSRAEISLFHLFNHAFPKAILFISAGLLIHASAGEQDLRFLKNTGMLYPLLFLFFFVSASALAGLPLLSVFYSKEIIFTLPFINFTLSSMFLYWTLMSLTIFTTLVYTTHLLNIFYSPSSLLPTPLFKLLTISNQSIVFSRSVFYPLLVLLILTIGAGIITFTFFSNLFNFQEVVLSVPRLQPTLIYEILPLSIKLVPIITSLLFSIIYLTWPITHKTILTSLVWFGETTNNRFVHYTLRKTYNVLQALDKGIFEKFIPQILWQNIFLTSFNIRFSNTGQVRIYFTSVSLYLLCFLPLFIIITERL